MTLSHNPVGYLWYREISCFESNLVMPQQVCVCVCVCVYVCVCVPTGLPCHGLSRPYINHTKGALLKIVCYGIFTVTSDNSSDLALKLCNNGWGVIWY